jgi:hypothetical protein
MMSLYEREIVGKLVIWFLLKLSWEPVLEVLKTLSWLVDLTTTSCKVLEASTNLKFALKLDLITS